MLRQDFVDKILVGMTEWPVANVVEQSCQFHTQDVFLGCPQIGLSCHDATRESFGQMGDAQGMFKATVGAIHVDIIGRGQLLDLTQALHGPRIHQCFCDGTNLNAGMNDIVGSIRLGCQVFTASVVGVVVVAGLG